MNRKPRAALAERLALPREGSGSRGGPQEPLSAPCAKAREKCGLARREKDGKWLISQLTETGAPLGADAEAHLRGLEWLVGDWVDRSEGVEAKTKVAWTTNRAFLTRSFSVAREGVAAHEGTEVIGWDPTLGKVRSWLFEADGSFSENVWTQDGRRWLIQSKTTLPDGGLGSAQHTLTWVADGKFTWSSANRQLDGELRPNIDPIEIIRTK